VREREREREKKKKTEEKLFNIDFVIIF
jgi:hypothetical protein